MAGRGKGRGLKQTSGGVDYSFGRDSGRNKLPSIIAYEEDEKDLLAWKYLSVAQMIDLDQLTVDGVQERLGKFLDLKDCQISMKDGIILDYYVSGYWWAKEQNFTMKQISSFITLLKIILDNVSNKRMSLMDNIKELAKVLSGNCHSNLKTNGFTNDQSKAIINYINISLLLPLHQKSAAHAGDTVPYVLWHNAISHSLFQHYKLYEFIFTQTPDIEILRTELEVELVTSTDPFPPPLEEGLSWDIFESVVLRPLKHSEVESAPEDEESKDTTDITTVDRLASYTIEDVKLVLGQVTAEVLGRVETEINEKLHKQEEAYSTRIEKLKNP